MTPPPFDPAHPATWPLVLTFAEVAQVLRISTRSAYELRAAHRFPVPELTPRLAKAPRYHRDDVLQALRSRSGQATALERRQVLARAR